MENLPEKMEERITFLREQGFSEEAILKSLITTGQPKSGTADKDISVHGDPASQDSIRGQQTAATVPASEHNKSDEMEDDAYKGMEEDEDEDEDGIPDDEEEERPAFKAKKSVKKSAAASLDDYADTYLADLRKSTPEMQSYLDISPALDGVAQTSAEAFAGLAVENQEMKSEIATLKSMVKSMAADAKAIRKMIVDSHNTQVKVLKSLRTEQTLAKSEAAAPVAGGVVMSVPATETPVAKGILGESVSKNRATIQERLEKAASSGERGATKFLTLLDGARTVQDQKALIGRMPKEWFA